MVVKSEDPLVKIIDTEAMGYGEISSSSGKAAADSKYVRFWVLVSGLMFFFGCHNYLQELIMSLPGFNVRYIWRYCFFRQFAIDCYFKN